MKTLLLSTLAATAATATDLLLPLYQFPANNGGAWDPVVAALTANPALNAKIIINPHNGPGGPNEGLEDPQYVAGSQALAALPNVELIGYVHTSTDFGLTRCNRPWGEITADIRKWSTWVDAGIAIRGIFIDEAPNSDANDCVAYMQNLTTLIRDDPALQFGARPVVVFNPGGTGALQVYYDMQPDLIVALETCFTVPEQAERVAYDDQCPETGGYERYDHGGVGSTIDTVLFPNIGAANAAGTAVLVHGFHHFNGPEANLTATEAVLGQLIQAAVNREIGATFFNTAGYHTFTDGPATIGKVADALNAANAA